MEPMWSELSERSVIGGIMINNQAVTDVAAIIQPADFYKQSHREIFKAAIDMHAAGEPIDVITLSDAVRSQGHVQLVGAIAYEVPSAANIEAYAERISDYSRRRAVMAACSEAMQAARNTEAGELISDLSSKLEGAGKQAIGESLDWNCILERLISEIERSSQSGEDGITGIRTGIPMIDRAMGGLCKQRFIALAARPSIGKTALANQIAVNAAKDGVPGGICSLEMGEEELGARAMSYYCRANFTLLMRGEEKALTAMVNGMSKGNPQSWPLHIDTSTYSLSGIEARITSWVRNHGIQYAVVDHIGLVEVEGDKSTYDRVSLVSRRLKKLAKRLDIAIIGVCQLNRGPEKDKRKPILGDLRDSGNIEQDIDIALFLHVDPEDIGSDVTPVEVGFLKNRTGRRGWLPEPLHFEGRYQTFTEYSPEYDDFDL